MKRFILLLIICFVLSIVSSKNPADLGAWSNYDHKIHESIVSVSFIEPQSDAGAAATTVQAAAAAGALLIQAAGALTHLIGFGDGGYQSMELMYYDPNDFSNFDNIQ